MKGALPYRFWKRTSSGGLPTRCFLIDTVCGKDREPILYQLNFYDVGGRILLTDFFPHEWRNDPSCMRRIASREGRCVDMRSLVKTCCAIFLNEIVQTESDAVMVVRGNHLPEERTDGISRKTRIYRRILSPLAADEGLTVVDGCDGNSFFLMREASALRREDASARYRNFMEGKK